MAYSTDPTLWLYTSLSSGSSQIVTATSRMETILKANKIPFKATDVATDEKARMLWGRRAGKRKLPGLVRMGMVLADLDEVEEWNEYGEIQENLGPEKPPAPAKPTSVVPSSPPSSSSGPAAAPLPILKSDTATAAAPASKPVSSTEAAKSPDEETSSKKPADAASSLATAMQQIGFEAAEKASKAKSKLRSPGTSTASTTGKDSVAAKDTKVADASDVTATTAPDTATTGETDATENSKEVTASTTEASTAEVADREESKPDAEGAESPLPGPNPITEASSETLAPTGSPKPTKESETHSLGGETAKYQGSSISAASEEETEGIDEAAKITEEPDKASHEAIANAEKPKDQTNTESIEEAETTTSTEAAPITSKIDSPEASTAATASEEEVAPSDAELEKLAAKRQAEPHVKFVGETPGQEIDRVKATLGGKPVSESTAGKTASVDGKSSVAATDEAEALPGSRTQDQEAADASKAGESVAD